MSSLSYVLTLSCPDEIGIVARVTTFLAEHKFNIVESAQFGDDSTNRFFLRIAFSSKSSMFIDYVRDIFAPLGDSLNGRWEIHGANAKLRVAILVSKIGHCLNDLLFRQQAGNLPIVIPLIISNHEDYAPLAKSYKIPFHYIAWTPDKAQAEQKMLQLISAHHIQLCVLARFMQVLSASSCAIAPPIINIHHSFLPAFKGAKPYHAAYARGVKAVGATAHFATADLDEGPIIEQDMTRVTHNMNAKELTQVGATIEATVLARAVRWYAEHRVLLNGSKTVVFA